jgi:hypothetical protein
MNPFTWAVAIAMGIFVGTLISLETGFRWGRRDVSRAAGSPHEGVGGIEASAFALLGLLLAFSFAGATSRLEDKRALIVAETNAIDTAYLRVDTLRADVQPPIRHEFKRLVDARVRAYEDRARATEFCSRDRRQSSASGPSSWTPPRHFQAIGRRSSWSRSTRCSA